MNTTYKTVEYIWIDGTKPTSKLRSKTKVIPSHTKNLPDWSFDGSSTQQAKGSSSDKVLKPVRTVPDPIRGGNALLALCEVWTPLDSTVIPCDSNTRFNLTLEVEQKPELDAWIGFEQEYTLFKGSRPLGFPSEQRFPAAQGPYYCGVGADEVSGREIVEEHLQLCLKAGLSIQGINAEVMPGQWEFQIGGPDVGPIQASDELWLARWLLYRIGEKYGVSATLDPKPVPGDWNGAGMHTNFSTASTRDVNGIEHIKIILENMSTEIEYALDNYGHGYEIRLTGNHETCKYDEFKVGVSDRTASVRIPLTTQQEARGYFEDRRPNANADPYRVAKVLVALANYD
jgi:glutamine synthetase